MPTPKKSVLNLATALLYKLVTCAIGLIIPRIFVMSYGSELNGLQSSVTQIFAFVALIEAGVGEATIQALFGPVARKDYNSANGILSATTYYYNKIGFLYFGILIGIAAIYPLIVEVRSISYLTVFAYIFFAGATTGVNFFYQSKIILVMQAEGDMYYNSLLTMSAYILTSAIKIALILTGQNILLIQIAFFLVNLAFVYAYYIIACRRYTWINFKEKPDLKSIEQKSSVLIHKISGLVFNGTDIILLTFICNLEVVSIYMMYKLVISMITTIIASFGDSVNYKLGQTFNNANRGCYLRMIDAFNTGYSALAFALFAVTSFLIIPFLRLYTDGMDINYIFPLLPLFYVASEALQVGREAMLRTVTVAGHFRQTLHQSIGEMCINIVVSICGIILCKHLWGEEAALFGALSGTIAALLYRTFALNRYANRRILNRSAWKTNKVMFVNIALYVVLYLANMRLDWSVVNSYGSFLIAAIILTPIVLLLYAAAQIAFSRSDFRALIALVRR